MTKSEKTVRSLMKDAGEPLGSLLLFLYEASMLADLQTLEACQWWADSLRAVADAVETDYGQPNKPVPERAATPVRRKITNRKKAKQ